MLCLKHLKFTFGILPFLILGIVLFQNTAHAATITVNDTGMGLKANFTNCNCEAVDADPSSCTLQAAIQLAGMEGFIERACLIIFHHGKTEDLPQGSIGHLVLNGNIPT